MRDSAERYPKLIDAARAAASVDYLHRSRAIQYFAYRSSVTGLERPSAENIDMQILIPNSPESSGPKVLNSNSRLVSFDLAVSERRRHAALDSYVRGMLDIMDVLEEFEATVPASLESGSPT